MNLVEKMGSGGILIIGLILGVSIIGIILTMYFLHKAGVWGMW